MTQQVPEMFEYQDYEYTLVGITGGDLVSADDLGLRFESAPTANWRGWVMTYGVDKGNRFVIRHIKGTLIEHKPVRGIYPVENEYGESHYQIIDYPVQLTGYVLFSNCGRVHDIYEMANEHPFAVYEAQVLAGTVLEIRDCSQEIESRLKASGEKPPVPYFAWGKSAAENLKSVEMEWNWTASFLPRRYDVLNMHVSYWSFKDTIKRLHEKVKSETGDEF